ncbi:MAG: metallophosphatase [Cyanobacteria bacterium J06592_8]
MWAILSGIEGNLKAYEAVLNDFKQQNFPIEELYIIGDLVGLNPQAEAVVERVREPQTGELTPQVCIGWWEEQCFNLYGLGSNIEATELREKYGADGVELLWDCVSRETVQWLKQQHFGFFEFDCLLIHGSSVSVDDELTPQTPPWKLLDRLQRVEANRLFCGRSGLTFQYELETGSIFSSVLTLNEQQPTQTFTPSKKQVIGVGNVGREPGKATYTLYHPGSDFIEFKEAFYSL